MTAAIASGKGGTGKTFLAVNLACVSDGRATLLDCDVEEPNTHIFLSSIKKQAQSVERMIPRINHTLCRLCGECSRFCAFNALAVLGDTLQFFPQLCHSCGGCMFVCRNKAIDESTENIGRIVQMHTEKCALIQGILEIGTAITPPLIHRVTERIHGKHHYIIDASPGSGCSAMAAISAADFVVLVAEPTPFGLHDMKRLVKSLKLMDKPFSAIVNRIDQEENEVSTYCSNENIPIIAQVPDDRRIAECCSQGGLVIEKLPEYYDLFSQLYIDIFGENLE